MNMKRFVIAAIGAFVLVFLYEFLVHGFLMTGLYTQTSSVWRPQNESNMAVMLLSQLLTGAAIAFFYPIVGPDTECKKAIPFGVGLGLVMAMPQIGTYCYLPIPLTISLLWALIAFVKALGGVYVVSKIYNWK
jgi:uncharacterized protein involved in response to NO